MTKSAQKPFVLGVDPGFSGALAILDIAHKTPMAVFDMPTTTKTLLLDPKENGRAEIDRDELVKLLKPFCDKTALAVVERVHASPGAGVTSMFRFGEGYGLILGVLAVWGIRVVTPNPSVWKVQMGLTHDKKRSLHAIEEYFGLQTRNAHCPLTKHHGRAEAMLLGLYGIKNLIPKNEFFT